MVDVVMTLSDNEFVRFFREDDQRKDNFSIENLKVIYEDLWDESESIGEPLEFDIVNICQGYGEMSYEEFINEFLEGKETNLEEIKDLDYVVNIDSKNNILYKKH